MEALHSILWHRRVKETRAANYAFGERTLHGVNGIYVHDIADFHKAAHNYSQFVDFDGSRCVLALRA
jgi:hypothetical protein